MPFINRRMCRGPVVVAAVLISPSLWANQNDDAFKDYVNNVICNNPQGDLVITCNAASTTVGGSGNTLPQTANISAQGVNELSSRESTNKAKLSQQSEEDAARVQMQRWGVFGGIDYRNLDRDDTTIETGYDGRTVVLTVGADYRLTRDLLAGTALSYADTRMNFSGRSATMDVTGYEWVAFANYQFSDWLYMDGYLGTTQQKNDGSRAVSFGLIQYDAQTDFDSDNTQWGLGMGTQTAFNNLALDVSLRFDSSRVKVDAYTEKGGDSIENLNLRYDSQTIDSNQVKLAINSALNLSLQNGVMAPYVRAEVINELETDARAITSHLVLAPDEPAFVATTDKPDDLYGRIAMGVQYLKAGGVMLYLDAEGLVGHAFLNNWGLSSGFRLEL